jgi:hypothetical protein
VKDVCKCAAAAGTKYVAEYVNDCPSCGSFFELGDDDVEPPPNQQLRGTIAAGTLRQHVASQQQPTQLPALQLSQPSKVGGPSCSSSSSDTRPND